MFIPALPSFVTIKVLVEEVTVVLSLRLLLGDKRLHLPRSLSSDDGEVVVAPMIASMIL